MRSHRSYFLQRSSTVAVVMMLLWQQPLQAQTFEITPEVDHLLRSALNEMYGYELDEADKKFDELVRRFPNHPVGYMHKAEAAWWRALRNNKDLALNTTFERYTNEAVAKGEQILKGNPHDFYSLIYIAGAFGNRTRYNIYITRSYYRAMRTGLAGYDYVKRAHALRNDYVDCLIGTGTYNYFAGSLPAVIRVFSWMFAERGDKEKGIQQLQTAAKNGEYGQTAAKTVLLGAYYNEKRFDDYRQLLKELIAQYPTNPVFVTWLSDFYIRQRKLDEGIQFFTELLNQRSDRYRGSLATTQALCEKGRLELEKRALNDSIASFDRVIESKPQDAPLIAKAHLLRAFALDLTGRRASAVADYQAILKLTDIENSHKKALLFLGTPYRGVQRR